ncbi:hypothetical protein BJX66DRAFT_310155 [Aspergillus keveii]|uniref:Uncharacterized protein n=1 Tax=Aspergillus keveii TaxID=714993 RepID=A0ABR4FX04_9EURO
MCLVHSMIKACLLKQRTLFTSQPAGKYQLPGTYILWSYVRWSTPQSFKILAVFTPLCEVWCGQCMKQQRQRPWKTRRGGSALLLHLGLLSISGSCGADP